MILRSRNAKAKVEIVCGAKGSALKTISAMRVAKTSSLMLRGILRIRWSEGRKSKLGKKPEGRSGSSCAPRRHSRHKAATIRLVDYLLAAVPADSGVEKVVTKAARTSETPQPPETSLGGKLRDRSEENA
jgi:hypothetical protein